jgi:hypothetical protein
VCNIPLQQSTNSSFLSCASICACMSLKDDPKEGLRLSDWKEPHDDDNQIRAGVCPTMNKTANWDANCPSIYSSIEYISGQCLSEPESEIPCNGPGVSYYMFTIGWYTIILLTNLLMFLCFCYCFGVCRPRRS